MTHHRQYSGSVSSKDEVDNTLTPLGFVWEHTGGGCTAYVRADGSFITYITRHDEPTAPQAMTEPVDIGTYRLDTGDLVEWIAENVVLTDAIRHIA